jgi:translation machinery-associated protein 16
MHSLSSGSPLTLASLKGLIEVYIARNDERIQELIAERRPGRPKQPELLDLEEKRRMDEKEFESGMGESYRI